MIISSFSIGGCGFTSRRVYPPEAENTEPQAVVATDINDDQKVDVIVANSGTNNVGVRLNVGNGMFTGQTMYSTGQQLFAAISDNSRC